MQSSPFPRTSVLTVDLSPIFTDNYLVDCGFEKDESSSVMCKEAPETTKRTKEEAFILESFIQCFFDYWKKRFVPNTSFHLDLY